MTNMTDKPVIIDKSALEEKLKDFSSLLTSIESVDDKTRMLWKEIYNNAINDRLNASILFLQLFEITTNKSSEYAVHGKTMASFIERMAKANDQLIRLAQLVADSKRADNNINPDDIFEKINSTKKH